MVFLFDLLGTIAWVDLAHLLAKIGPFFLFFVLFLGIVGLPIPDEILLMTAGHLVSVNKLSFPYTVIAAVAGSIGGITMSYLLGRLIGYIVIKKYGKALNLTEERILTTKKWFRKIGAWVLIVGYYLPLFRHIIGFVAGLMKLDYKYFALYAYTGAVIWSLGFFFLGYFFFTWFKNLLNF